MKIGKKLEITDIKERLKLLIDGEVFYTDDGRKISMDNRATFMVNNSYIRDKVKVLREDWYYPAKTYKINGVELVDERVTDHPMSINPSYYIPAIFESDFYYSIYYGHRDFDEALARGLVFKTKEAAIAHAQAMIRVEEGEA